MKWIIGFGLVLLLGHFHFVIPLADASLLGLPLWLYAFGVLHLLYIYLLYRYSKTLNEEVL